MSDDNITPSSSSEYSRNCLLDNLPTVPTKNQLELIADFQMSWLFPAAVAPFILLVVIGGWGGTFQSGDASAYMVGAVIVCATESIFQQREDNFAILKKRWKESRSKPGHRTTQDAPIPVILAVVVALIIWNTYFAIHDRHIGTPSVDWVQILIFFLSLVMLPGIRFAATQFDEPVPGKTEWTDFLRERIHSLHSKANRLVQDADIQLGNYTRNSIYKLDDARDIFKKIDDYWCAAHAASIQADAWKTLGDLKKAQRARYIADDLLKECKE